MFSIKVLIECVVEQGRRAVLLATRSRIHSCEPYKGLKLTETQAQTGACRPRPKDVIPSHHVAETCPQNSGSSVSSRGGIVNFLRPVTSRIVQGLVRRVSSPLWLEARRKGAKRLFGETAPYFALVGVTLVSGPERGLLTAQDELEAICGDIREAISRAGWIHNPNFWKTLKPEPCIVQNQEFSLANFELGAAISKGCSAVVYAARWKQDVKTPAGTEDDSLERDTSRKAESISRSLESWESLLPSGSLWFLNGEGRKEEDHFSSGTSSEREGSDESAFFLNKESPHKQHMQEPCKAWTAGCSPTIPNLTVSLSDSYPESAQRPGSLAAAGFDSLSLGGSDKNEERPHRRKKVKFKAVADLSEAFSLGEELWPPAGPADDMPRTASGSSSSTETYPLAVKMMFNYEAESNAPAILTAMYKEMLPARAVQLDASSSLWMQRLMNTSMSLPLHTNIVDMPCVFVDRIPFLADGLSLYPDALPKRINPGGFGRNMSLFCVMKRYDCTLAQYLTQQTLSLRTSLLLVTQLVEAVNHINKYGVAHRDLKCDNVLLCLREGVESPHLVLSDFGCCLVDPGLRVGFFSYEADPRVGNAALMAPEIKSAIPGMFTWLNYSKADLWAVGALAYEIFGLQNPFVPSWGATGTTEVLDAASYRETQLPKLPKTIPAEIRCLIQGFLRRNPKQRPTPTLAATVCQLSLWCPRKWLNRHALTMPSSNEVMRWLLCMSSKVLCEAGCMTGTSPVEERAERASPGRSLAEKTGGQLEYEVVSTFLKRVHYEDIIQAIRWIRTV